jgi:hypothetical protein
MREDQEDKEIKDEYICEENKKVDIINLGSNIKEYDC